jgi:hypothetical protein
MNLVKWLRKNNKKIMAIVVILIMVGFVCGSYLSYQSRRASGLQDTVGHFLNNKRITNKDLRHAQEELDVLRMLRADLLLRNQDIQGILLGELMFSERRTEPALINHVRQTIRTNEYRISEKQIADIYKHPWPGRLYWLLLSKEAELAGIRMPNEYVGNLLGSAIPQLSGGLTYRQLVGEIVNRQGVPQSRVLAAFGKLLAVLQYANLMCMSEDVTISQIMSGAQLENETLDVEFVKFDSAFFAETLPEPNEERMVEHFDKYKRFSAGETSVENPYGFGYMLPDRVQLEYIAVKLDDVAKIIEAPTHEEIEDYYQKNRSSFTEQVPAVPGDANSSPSTRVKSFVEVAATISGRLVKERIKTKAEGILLEARTLTEGRLEDSETDRDSLTAEQFKELAGDYRGAAERLTEKHKIEVRTGRTGLLSAGDMQTNEHLARLFLEGPGEFPVRLTTVVFAIGELEASELGPFDAMKPKMYENLGPARDAFAEIMEESSGQVMALLRVIAAEKASVPESIDYIFSTRAMVLDPNEEKAGEGIYAVREKVSEDLKKLEAMETSRSKCQEFKDLVAKEGWEDTIREFNEQHAKQTERDANDPNVFKLDTLTRLRRISRAQLETVSAQSEGEPLGHLLLNEIKTNKQFIDDLFALVPEDSNTVDDLPVIFEFKPAKSVYCLKSISVGRLYRENFERLKPMRLYRETRIQSQSLAAVHLNPENILKRMNFRPVKEAKEATDANKPEESEEAL